MNELYLTRKRLFGSSLLLIIICLSLFLLYGCTLSFQNISTHGVAEDLVDETQSNTPNISPNIEVPVSPL